MSNGQPEMETFCFDLKKKTLPLPRIPTNIVYYKRQLRIYNLGIHSGKDNKGQCYVWIEGEAGRRAQKVGSCLKKHIEENDIENRKISWLKTREIEIRKDKPLSIFMKTDFNTSEVEVDLHKKLQKGRPVAMQSLSNHLIPLWPTGKPLSVPKLNDLRFLMHLIPNDAKPLYRSLFSNNTVEDDIDGFDGDLDFDIRDE
ncbi:unnamed protein product [Diabrotica balteata]|uniref:Uncharacterized protein n=1 Tax=Diabrotica balteata TaxID=107213 RepID=A0A9N9T8I6_DIABA|nr:unnamed protein product [Diabrotica balteata]